jgi:hypothetical protein
MARSASQLTANKRFSSRMSIGLWIIGT